MYRFTREYCVSSTVTTNTTTSTMGVLDQATKSVWQLTGEYLHYWFWSEPLMELNLCINAFTFLWEIYTQNGSTTVLLKYNNCLFRLWLVPTNPTISSMTKILQGTQPFVFHRIPVHLHYNTLVKSNGFEGISLQHVSKSAFDTLQLKSVGMPLPLLQLQVLKATMWSWFLDNYHLLFTFIVHGHTVTSTNTLVPFNRTLLCLELHSIWITVCKTGSSTL